MKLRRRRMQTLGVSVNQLRRKLLELSGCLLHVQNSKTARDMALVMLSVSPGIEVGSGGGHVGLSRQGFKDGLVTRNMKEVHEAMIATARDRAVRTGSVRQDLALDLPPRLQLPDGEERPYGAHMSIHLRDAEQEREIYQKCVRPPPNRTIFDSESPPLYRSKLVLLEQPQQIVQCHSASNSLLKVLRKSLSSSGNSGVMTMTNTGTTTVTSPPKLAVSAVTTTVMSVVTKSMKTTTSTLTTMMTTTMTTTPSRRFSGYSNVNNNVKHLTVLSSETNENQ